MSQNFYVYLHIRKDGTPFYVGKGRGKRAFASSKRERGMHWKQIVEAEFSQSYIPKENVVFLSTFLSEEDALNIEKYWIALFGRQDIHLSGVLVNKTDGGDGVSGYRHTTEAIHRIKLCRSRQKKYVHTEETKKRISKSLTGKTGKIGFSGKSHREEVKKRIGLKLSGKNNPNYGGKLLTTTVIEKIRTKTIKCGIRTALLKSPNGELIECGNRAEFARRFNLDAKRICRLIDGSASSHKGWTFVKKLE